MAKQKQKKPARSRRKTQLSGIWLWVVVGVIALAALYMLARTLSQSAVRIAPTPFLSLVKTDLLTVTRMLGDIELDPGWTADLPDDVRTRFERIDSMIAERSWPDAVAQLERIRKSMPADKAALVNAYLGFCYHKSAGPDQAVREFRAGLEQTGTDPELRLWFTFSSAYLYQARGYADSAAVWYEAARKHLETAPTLSSSLQPALLNNLGLAYEVLADTAQALDLYLAAAAFVDTTADTRQARVVLDNVRRLSPRRLAPAEN